MVNYHLKITGHVQGVGFRFRVCQLARQQGITGMIKNLADGSVYCELQGPTVQVNKLLAQIKAGPTPAARVAEVEVQSGTLQDYQHSFHIIVDDFR